MNFGSLDMSENQIVIIYDLFESRPSHAEPGKAINSAAAYFLSDILAKVTVQLSGECKCSYIWLCSPTFGLYYARRRQRQSRRGTGQRATISHNFSLFPLLFAFSAAEEMKKGGTKFEMKWLSCKNTTSCFVKAATSIESFE